MDSDTIALQLCSIPSDPTSCCGSHFPNKTASGLCARCTKIQAAGSEQERADILTMPYCHGCSAVIRFSVGVYCGLCQMKLPQDGSQNMNLGNSHVAFNNVNNNPSGAAADIRELMANCTAKKIHPAAKETVNNSATVLEGSRKIYVHMVVSCPGTEAANVLGVVAKHFPETDLLLRWKSEWDSCRTGSLTFEFIVPRFYRNFNPEPDSTLGTLGEFYDLHNLLLNTQHAKCFALPSNMKFQPPYIYLEARILAEEQKKRKFTFDAANIQAKKVRGTLTSALPPLKSQFRPVVTYTDIVVASATIKVDDEAGVVSKTYPDLGDPELVVEKCEIAQELVGKGMSQYVYKGIFHKEPCTFKRFFNIGNGRDQVTLVENREELYKEAARLHQMGWFLSAFLERAQEAHINIDEYISVTQCKLVVEVTKQGEAPSKASGYLLSDVESTECPMDWLIEPFRLGRAEKWSGTNQHPNHFQNKLGNILNSFAHFVYDASYKSIALANIQSKFAVLECSSHSEENQATKAHIGNRVSQVLFDLTTHTSSGDSGVGDHGQDGINTFVEQHVCTSHCESLGLVPLSDQDKEGNNEEDDDE
ncbi:kinase-like domain-containing protein [Mycena albidolilacea]|uniref:Kinase-like domain-containing protein n=1 Tax=Mycena albidolilacea TaxID=1033008 RepID=A0AAD6Z5R4_9AGAR|nr:kinase-like domain-containing protein [Mycena albidolilacea]